MLQLNSPAPSVILPNETGTVTNILDVKTTYILLYFYPKDDTPGCTTEACGLRDNFAEIQQLNCTIFGISKDSPASHQKFITKYSLPFSLLSDESTETIQAFGAWQEKSMYGKKYMGIARMSILLKKDGTVLKIYPKVTPSEHAAEIMEDLKNM